MLLVMLRVNVISHIYLNINFDIKLTMIIYKMSDEYDIEEYKDEFLLHCKKVTIMRLEISLVDSEVKINTLNIINEKGLNHSQEFIENNI